MYIPKNRIITDLYTNGNEYTLSTTGKVYVGSYYKTYEGKFYTGKNQNDKPTIELFPLDVIKNKDGEETFIDSNQDPSRFAPSDSPNSAVFIDNSIYLFLKKDDPTSFKRLPSTYYPALTKDDYKLGEFQRYFAKKTNESIYIEINKDTYDKLKSRNNEWLWNLYEVIQLPWELTGDIKNVYTINKNTVTLVEQKNQIVGLSAYLRNDFLKFYKYEPKNNLSTNGNDFIDGDGKFYVGFYHIEASRGYVEGPTPGPRQKRLFIRDLYANKKLTT